MAKTKQKFRFGVTLSGGGATGLLQIGILDVLEENNIHADCISGASIGAMLGAAYAMGIPPKEIFKISQTISSNLFRLKNLNIFNESLIKNDYIKDFLEKMFGHATFDNCRIPFRAIAVDVESGQPVILKSGRLVDALLASGATPIIFPPVFLDNRVLVDGGLINNIPLNILDEFKPAVKMAVLINEFSSRRRLSAAIFEHYMAPRFNNLFKPYNFIKKIEKNLNLITSIFLRALELRVLSHPTLQVLSTPELLIRPDTNIGFLEFERSAEAYQVGRKVMLASLPQLNRLLNKKT